MNVNLDNKVAIVTGGTRGIGFACAKLLASSGAKVALVDRQAENVAKATELLQGKGTVKGYQLDVADISAIGPTVEHIRNDMGEVDILVCSAGTDIGAPLPAASPYALTTIGTPTSFMYSYAFSKSSKIRKAAVGTFYLPISSLANILLDSILAAPYDGPNTLIPAPSRSSAIPTARGASGPTTTRSIL